MGGSVCVVGVLDYVVTYLAHSDTFTPQYSEGAMVSLYENHASKVSTSTVSPNVNKEENDTL